MKILIAITLFVFTQFSAISQKNQPEIEIAPYFRMDWYPKFNYAYNSVSTNSVKITGAGWGAAIAYKIPASKRLNYRLGIGYYKYAFNKIVQNNSMSGKSKTRIVEGYSPPGGITPALIFLTDKYWYNTLSIDIGLEKKVDISSKLQLSYGIEISNYFTFSQQYHITYPAPRGDDHRLTEFRYFGLSAKLIAGLRKNFGNVTIGPNVIVPVFDNWRKDDIFPEEKNSESRNKWLGGLAVGISVAFKM